MLRVLNCGPGSTLQDMGRVGMRRFGVSTSGAMDRASLVIANALVGNDPGDAAIEFTMQGGSFVVEDHPVMVALGGCASLAVNGQPVPPGQSISGNPGDTLDVSPVRHAIYAYLALAGGIDVPCEMASRSVHQRSGIGGRPLQSGDRLRGRGAAILSEMMLDQSYRETDGPIRIVAGPQDDYFAPSALETLQATTFKKGMRSDRMGIFLDGFSPQVTKRESMVSDGVLPGSIQVPSDNSLIVLMRDCQSTGGYPKIATVISADLDRLAQILPGGLLRFELVSVQQALEAARERHDRLLAMIRTRAQVVDLLNSERLLSLNLVDGLVDAHSTDDTEASSTG